MPVVRSLPLEEQRRLMELLSKRINKKEPKPSRKKPDIYAKIGEEFRPGNEEMLMEQLGINDELYS